MKRQTTQWPNEKRQQKKQQKNPTTKDVQNTTQKT
jgi:hypothetical protein